MKALALVLLLGCTPTPLCTQAIRMPPRRQWRADPVLCVRLCRAPGLEQEVAFGNRCAHRLLVASCLVLGPEQCQHDMEVNDALHRLHH